MSEARTEDRLDRLEGDVHDIRATLARLEPLIIRIDERLNSELPHLATKAEVAMAFGELKAGLAEKPNRAELWWMVAAMTGGFAVILTALTFLH